MSQPGIPAAPTVVAGPILKLCEALILTTVESTDMQEYLQVVCERHLG